MPSDVRPPEFRVRRNLVFAGAPNPRPRQHRSPDSSIPSRILPVNIIAIYYKTGFYSCAAGFRRRRLPPRLRPRGVLGAGPPRQGARRTRRAADPMLGPEPGRSAAQSASARSTIGQGLEPVLRCLQVSCGEIFQSVECAVAGSRRDFVLRHRLLRSTISSDPDPAGRIVLVLLGIFGLWAASDRQRGGATRADPGTTQRILE